jgi:hypothetical protein
MRIITISLLALLLSCDKEQSTKKELCNCHEEHYSKQVTQGATGNLIVTWQVNYNTTSQPELCEKETGQWVEYDNSNKKYKVVCN